MSFMAPKSEPMAMPTARKGFIAGDAAPTTSLMDAAPVAPQAPPLMSTSAPSRPQGTNKKPAQTQTSFFDKQAKGSQGKPTYNVGASTPPSYGQNTLMGQV